MIELIHVSKGYRTKTGWHKVLDDVSVRFPRGHNIGILGVNGSGKSTLIRLLCGIESPDKGTIRRNVRLSWPLGFSGGFQSSLSGRENAEFIARIHGVPVKPFVEFARNFSELGHYFEMPMKSYSSGMRARFAFAVSLAADFDCYLVDEVTAVGDKRFKDRYREAFAERKERANIIMVSHNPSTIRRDCDMGAVLHQGSLTLYDDVEEAIAEYVRVNDLPNPKVKSTDDKTSAQSWDDDDEDEFGTNDIIPPAKRQAGKRAKRIAAITVPMGAAEMQAGTPTTGEEAKPTKPAKPGGPRRKSAAGGTAGRSDDTAPTVPGKRAAKHLLRIVVNTRPDSAKNKSDSRLKKKRDTGTDEAILPPQSSQDDKNEE